MSTKNSYTQNQWADFEDGQIAHQFDRRCQVEMPGFGQCEVVGEHKLDGVGREIHVVGACSWNGGNLIEVDDNALRTQAREDRESRERPRDEEGWPARWSDPAYLGDGPWGA